MQEEKNNKFCFNCGTEMFSKAEICPKCGARQINHFTEGKVSNLWYLFAFFFGIIGGVIAWIVNKDRNPKKAKRFIIVSCIWPAIGILATLIVVPLSLQDSREKAKDARRDSDMRQISLAMEMYCDGNNNYDKNDYSCYYLQSAIMPDSIGDYLNPLPEDPGGGPCPSYKWISNLSDPKKFCVYACLSDGTFSAASQKGVNALYQVPTNLEDCF